MIVVSKITEPIQTDENSNDLGNNDSDPTDEAPAITDNIKPGISKMFLRNANLASDAL